MFPVEGPNIMKKIAGELGYTPEQLKVIDSLKPENFPCYIYRDNQTRYWFGSNTALMNSFAKKITVEDFMQVLANSQANLSWKNDLIELLEKDLAWYRTKLFNTAASVRSIIGGNV